MAGTVFAIAIGSAAAMMPNSSASSIASDGVLPIPAHLTSDWTAPSGNFAAPSASVIVDAPVTVDLSAATITGGTGTAAYLFQLMNGGRLTILGGSITGPMTGLVLDSVGKAGTGGVAMNGTQTNGVQSLVFAAAASGPIDASLVGVTATGLGDGLRATMNAVDVSNSTLQGGGIAPLGSPAGIHSMDDPQFNVAVPGSHINVSGSSITGFRGPKFQGDSIIGETRVATADVENNVLGYSSDSAGIDSKIETVTFANNIVYSDGFRAIASHYGTVNSSGNVIYATAGGGKKNNIGYVYQASGTLNASNDTVTMGKGMYLAQTVIVLGPASGAPSTYPRIGAISLTGVVDAAGNLLKGPLKIATSTTYRTVITITA